jgi:hypothetical protein
MATGNINFIVRSIRGRMGDVIFKQYRYGTVITKVPDMSKAGSSEKQKTGRSMFKDAVAFARAAVADPKERERYKRMKGKGSPYNKAIKAYMKAHSTRDCFRRKKSGPSQPPNKAIIR